MTKAELAVTKAELAEAYLYELYNDAEHVYRLAQAARADLAGREIAGANLAETCALALETLRVAERPAGRIEMRLRDALRAVEAARSTEGE